MNVLFQKGGDFLVCFPLFGVTFEEELSSSQQIFLRLFENFRNGSEIFIEVYDVPLEFSKLSCLGEIKISESNR